MTTICPNCKEPNEADAAFCINCGQSLQPAAQPVSSTKAVRRIWVWGIMALLLIGIFTAAAMIGLRSLNQSDYPNVAATAYMPPPAQMSSTQSSTPTGQSAEILATQEQTVPADPVVISPEYKDMIVFVDGETMYLIESDGSNKRSLISDNVFSPKWSPDKRRIAFDCFSPDTENYQICTLNADGTGFQQITYSDQSNHEMGGWSPDGKKIMSIESGQDEYHFTIIDLSNPSDAIPLPVGGVYAAWSPDGTKIAYLEIQSGIWGLWVINSDGTGGKLLIELADRKTCIHKGAFCSPGGLDWSPDGTSILTSMLWEDVENFGPGTNLEIVVIRVADGSIRRVTKDKASDRSPTWSPDGTRIQFTRQIGVVGYETRIYTLNIEDLSDLKEITRGGWGDW